MLYKYFISNEQHSMLFNKPTCSAQTTLRHSDEQKSKNSDKKSCYDLHREFQRRAVGKRCRYTGTPVSGKMIIVAKRKVLPNVPHKKPKLKIRSKRESIRRPCGKRGSKLKPRSIKHKHKLRGRQKD